MLPDPEAQRSRIAVKRTRVDLDWQEIVTFGFVSSTMEAALDPAANPVKVLNPIAAQLDVPRLLEVAVGTRDGVRVKAESPRQRTDGREPLPGGDDERPSLETVLTEEMARHADDVVFRRLPIGHDPSEARRALPTIVERMTDRFGWDKGRRDEETARVIARLEAGAARLDEALGPS
jgi:glycerol-3-phosphate dehydrogenase